MSFVDNEEIKTALVAELKSRTAITSLLDSANEIKEVQYQGDTFKYPAVRVRIIDNVPVGNTGCYHKVTLGIQVNSQLDSSKEAEQISGIIGQELNGDSFRSVGVNFIMRLTNLVPALRVDERTWRSEALFTAIVS
jgi:hypothetical protein